MSLYFDGDYRLIIQKVDKDEAKVVVAMLVARRGEINIEKNKAEEVIETLTKSKDRKPEDKTMKELLEAQVVRQREKLTSLDNQIVKLRIKFGEGVDR